MTDGTYNAASQSAGAGSAYPVGVGIETSFEANRWWAIPILGFVGKGIVLIPHAIILTVLTLVVSLLQFVLWAPVIVTGRFPEWGHALVAGTVR
ncbi:MAG: hypothetical protein ACRDFX_06220, partial [Chloroflexota bacterium]